jgi:hypothetical protein
MLSKSVTFPDDIELDMYSVAYISEDTPWTILSYNYYGSIEYWWVLSALNKNNIFYAPAGHTIRYIKPSHIKHVISKINS